MLTHDKQLTMQEGCVFLKRALEVQAIPIDGEHLDKIRHKRLELWQLRTKL
jgi:hypothetical protein